MAPFFAKYVPTPHSVLTAHLIDEAGQPTVAARDEVLSFLKLRLQVPYAAHAEVMQDGRAVVGDAAQPRRGRE